MLMRNNYCPNIAQVTSVNKCGTSRLATRPTILFKIHISLGAINQVIFLTTSLTDNISFLAHCFNHFHPLCTVCFFILTCVGAASVQNYQWEGEDVRVDPTLAGEDDLYG